MSAFAATDGHMAAALKLVCSLKMRAGTVFSDPSFFEQLLLLLFFCLDCHSHHTLRLYSNSTSMPLKTATSWFEHQAVQPQKKYWITSARVVEYWPLTSNSFRRSFRRSKAWSVHRSEASSQWRSSAPAFSYSVCKVAFLKPSPKIFMLSPNSWELSENSWNWTGYDCRSDRALLRAQGAAFLVRVPGGRHHAIGATLEHPTWNRRQWWHDVR